MRSLITSLISATPHNASIAVGLCHPNARSTIRCHNGLAGTRSDRPKLRLTDLLLGALSMTERPFAIALTDHLLGASATTNKMVTAASTNHLLGVFGLADNLEGEVQRLDAESDNVLLQRLQVTFASPLAILGSPLQGDCYAASPGLISYIEIGR